MARRVFFSFHYEPDNWRASIVRNSGSFKDSAGFFDSAEWEKVKKEKDSEIKKWIDKQLQGTSVTVVLIGSKTAGREWINYEIMSSHKKGNGLLGIYIHNLKDKDSDNSEKGKNPFEAFKGEKGHNLSKIYPTYDWQEDNGYHNMPTWIEKAAKKAEACKKKKYINPPRASWIIPNTTCYTSFKPGHLRGGHNKES